MGAIATTDVTVIKSWRTPVRGGPEILNRIVDIALNGNGGTANDIPASYLGFKTIYTAYSIRHTATGPAYHCIPIIVEADSEGLLTINLEDSTDASRSDPANVHVAGTLRVFVMGLENN